MSTTEKSPPTFSTQSQGRSQRVFVFLVVMMLVFMLTENKWLKNSSNFLPTSCEQTQQSHNVQAPSFPVKDVLPLEFVTNDPLHVFFGLSGDHPGFFAELETAFKSVLLNAPLERNLTIHFIADEKAYQALDHLFDRTNITSWQSRTPVTIRTYNTQPYVKEWEDRVKTLCRKTGLESRIPVALTKHTLGAWFRLFAAEVLPSHVDTALYMDVDVVITANLESLARQIDPQYCFQWGDFRCSGFMVLSISKLKQVWEVAHAMDLHNVTKALKEDVTDQLVFLAIDEQHHDMVGRLSKEWDLSIANGAWRAQKRFPEVYPNLGMIHYNGGGSSKGPYWDGNWYFDDPIMKGSLGIPNYYIHMPWVWARSHAASQTSDKRRFYLQLLHRQNITTELNHTTR